MAKREGWATLNRIEDADAAMVWCAENPVPQRVIDDAMIDLSALGFHPHEPGIAETVLRKIIGLALYGQHLAAVERGVREPAEGPFTWEFIQVSEHPHYRIRDKDDNRVATCYLDEHALLVVRALNNLVRGTSERGVRETPVTESEVSAALQEYHADEWYYGAAGHADGPAMLAVLTRFVAARSGRRDGDPA